MTQILGQNNNHQIHYNKHNKHYKHYDKHNKHYNGPSKLTEELKKLYRALSMLIEVHKKLLRWIRSASWRSFLTYVEHVPTVEGIN